MKIVCTKEEYAYILRECFNSEAYEACTGCIFNGFYGKDCQGIEKIADVVIVSTERGGDDNG